LCVPGSDHSGRRAQLCVVEALLAACGRAGKPQLRTWLAEVCGDGPEQQSKGAVRPLGGAEGTHKRRLRETAHDTLFVKPL
jgi:hypothetical protein